MRCLKYRRLVIPAVLFLLSLTMWAQDRPVVVKETEARVLQGHKKGVTQVAFLNETQVVSSSLDHTLKVWDVTSAKCRATFTGHRDEVFALTVSADGKYLASTGYDGRIIVYKASGKILQTLKGFKRWTVCLAISPDSSILATCTMAGIIRGWDIQSGKTIFELKTRGWETAMAWSPDGNFLAVGNFNIEIWDLNQSKMIKTIQGHSNTIRSIAWHPQGDMLASCGLDKSVQLVDLSTGEIEAVIKPKGYIQTHDNKMYRVPLPMVLTAVTFSPDGKILAFAGAGHIIYLRDISTQEELRILVGHKMTVTGIAFSPDGKTLASSSLDRTLRLWKLD